MGKENTGRAAVVKTVAQRKAEALARKRSERKVMRKTGKVKIYRVPIAKGAPKGSRKVEVFMQTPVELSPEAEWADERPKVVHPFDWHQLYPGPDKELWPIIKDEALYAVKVGELELYEGRANRGTTRKASNA